MRSNDSVVAAQRDFRIRFYADRHGAVLTRPKRMQWVRGFPTTGNITRKKKQQILREHCELRRTLRGSEQKCLEVPVVQLAEMHWHYVWDVSQSRKMLILDFKFYPYKIGSVHSLNCCIGVKRN